MKCQKQKSKFDYSYKYTEGETHVNLRVPAIRGCTYKGSLTINDDFLLFCQAVKAQHARNKVVYRSAFFSARITKDNCFSITCHFSAQDVISVKARQKIIMQFIKMMTTLENVLVTSNTTENEI